MNKTIFVDFDGTLAFYDGYKGDYELGQPIPKMVDRVKKWLKDGDRVKIFTARLSRIDGENRDVEKIRTLIEDWTEKNIGKRLEVTNIKDPSATEFWDDRAVGVIKNTGERTCNNFSEL